MVATAIRPDGFPAEALRAPAAPKVCARGTHRTVSPGETLARLRPHLGRFGITRVADVTGLDRIGIPVAMAHRPNSRSLSVSPGKGLDLEAAKVSALMEAVEGWHAENAKLPLVLGSISELARQHRLVDLAGLPRHSARPLARHQQLLWTEGRDLLSGEAVLVPYELVHMNYTLPLPPSSGAWLLSSNGLASGNHPLEALAHALCEVIERDAMSLFHARDELWRDGFRVQLDTIEDPDCRMLLRKLGHAGVEVAVWDVTSDIGVPAFACEIVDRDPSDGRPFLPGTGAGAHPSRSIALLRALSEAAQTRLTTVAGARDDLRVAQYVRSLDRASWRAAMKRVAVTGSRRFASAPDAAHVSFDDDVLWLLGRLASVGIEQVVAVDLTHGELDLAVVRVIVPGLEGPHDSAGALPGKRRRALAEVMA
jgi:YcaO-like protein with predicted kinase domain